MQLFVRCTLLAGLVAVALACTDVGLAQDKKEITKSILSDEQYDMLAKADAKVIETSLKAPKVLPKDLNRAKAAAAMMAFYGQSAPKQATLTDEALKVHAALAKKDSSGALKALEEVGKGQKGKNVDLTTVIELDAIMGQFNTSGLKLEKQLTELSKKGKTDNIEELASRLATIGQLTEAYAPKFVGNQAKGQTVKNWVKFSNDMRDSSLDLLKNAKGAEAAVKKSAGAVENSCNKCHEVFKDK